MQVAFLVTPGFGFEGFRVAGYICFGFEGFSVSGFGLSVSHSLLFIDYSLFLSVSGFKGFVFSGLLVN